MKRVAIFGTGAIGGLAGAYLVRSGFNVLFIDKDPWHIEAMKARGLYVHGNRGTFIVPVHHAIRPEELRENLELVLLAVKSQNTAEALNMMEPFLDENSVIVSMQNGFNEEVIAERFGEERTIGAYVSFSGDYKGPADLLEGVQGKLYIGELNGEITPRLQELQELLTHYTTTHITDNIWGYLWSKECYAAELVFTALADATLAEVVRSEQNKHLMIALVSEAAEVAKTSGIKLEPLDFCDPRRHPPKSAAETQVLLKELDKWGAFWATSAKKHTGFWHDLVYRRRKTEVDHIIGPIIQKGKELGVPTPLNEAVLRMINEIEDHKRPMSPKNFQEVAQLAEKLGITLP